MHIQVKESTYVHLQTAEKVGLYILFSGTELHFMTATFFKNLQRSLGVRFTAMPYNKMQWMNMWLSLPWIIDR